MEETITDDTQVLQQEGERMEEAANAEESIKEPDYKAEAEKAKAEVAKWKAIAERNKNKPQAPQQVQQPQEKDLSSKDIFALMEAKVPAMDIDEVIKASKLLGKSITEVLQDGLVKARLKDLLEQRETANATNTSGSKRTTAKLSDEDIMEKFRQGKDVDPEALALARINLKKKK
jgi:hypothetical protein